jgi:lipoprotein-anchoring transpeptidase ErfK/SrfK
VLVDKSDYMLYVIRSGAVVASYPIAIGMRGTPTPTGTFYLARPSRSPNRVWGPFRMRLYRKAWVRVAYRVRIRGHLLRRYHRVLKLKSTSYYIHGTNDPDSIGTPASHGCVRMWNSRLQLFRGLTVKYQMTIIRS